MFLLLLFLTLVLRFAMHYTLRCLSVNLNLPLAYLFLSLSYLLRQLYFLNVLFSIRRVSVGIDICLWSRVHRIRRNIFDSLCYLYLHKYTFGTSSTL